MLASYAVILRRSAMVTAPAAVVMIALSDGLGGLLRRGIAHLSRNAFIQPFAAALLAGAVGALAIRLQLTGAQRLVAVCPCMVLVPGPHLLNGAIDLMRAHDLEGIVAKRFADPYKPRVRWLKIKNPDYSQKEARGDLFNGPPRSAR